MVQSSHEQRIDSLKKKLVRSVLNNIVHFDQLHPSETQDAKKALIQSNNILKENLIFLLDNIKDNWNLLRDKDKESFYKIMDKLVKIDNLFEVYDALVNKNYIDELKKFTKMIEKKKQHTTVPPQTSKKTVPSQQVDVLYALKRMFQEKKKYSTQQQLSQQFLKSFLERSFFEMKYSLKLASDAIFNFNNYLKTEENVKMSDEVKSFLLTLTNLWTPTLKNNYEKMDKTDNTDEETKNVVKLLYYCAFIILDRTSKVLLKVDTKTKQEQFLQNTKIENILEHVETTLHRVKFPEKSQQSPPTRFPLLRQKLYKRSLSRKEEEPLPTQQQLKQWQQRYDMFLNQLQREQTQSKSLAISPPLPALPSYSQQEKKQQTLHRRQEQPHKMDYSFVLPSPYTHRNDPRFTQQQNRKLQQRKMTNRGTIQKSLADQSIPEKIMRMAVDGNYTCILLIDVSNQRENLNMPLEKLLPMEIPASFQKKPLFVLIEQGDLDLSGSAKVVLKRGARNTIHLEVSCAKQRQDGTITDCFKKQSDHDFTKNPMDDFVLLTLRHVLRSIYYKNMHNDKKVSKLKRLQDLVAQNPYSLLQNQQEIASLLQPIVNTYDKTLNTIPYTWSVSNDRFRDWKKE